MTIYIEESNNNVVEFAVNQADLALGNYELIITSQYSHQPLVLLAECILTNSRYSLFNTQFPTGFGEEHKNGIYYWDLVYLGTSLEKGLVKVITEPGGGINSLAYNAGAITDDRVSEVYFRPNY